MLDINFVREHPEEVKKGILAKGYDPSLVDGLLKAYTAFRASQLRVDNLRAERHRLTKDQRERGVQLKTELRELEAQLREAKKELSLKINLVPNLPLPIVPLGKGEKENVEVRRWGVPGKFSFNPRDHIELGKNLGILDFEAGAKVAGADFYFLYGDGALLELALVHYAFDLLSQEGFLPVITPDLARSRFYLGTGYLPKGKEAQTYTLEGEDLGLIATAEVTLAGKHADEIIPAEQLPRKYIGYSHCFRQEAGAYGKYSKGLYRVHQFTKAEMFIYCLPEESNEWHEYLLSMEEKICQGLNLPYRVVEMCTGDLGAMAARKFDIEAWMPGRTEYGEVTSTSNCTDYPARNLNVKFRRKDGRIGFVHMLNGTAIATSRIILAILENYQQADGSVKVPEVLQKYVGKKIIEAHG